MSAEARRPPKSSLAAAKAAAAPWGLTPPRPSASQKTAAPVGAPARATAGAARPYPTAANTAAAKTAAAQTAAAKAPHATRTRTTAGAASVPVTRPVNRAAALAAATQARSIHERRFTMALLASAVGLTVALAAVGARVTVVSASSKARMDGTLGRTSLEQMEFRAANQRFALWDELALLGATLPEHMEVVATNASHSHWFLKLRDRTTGISCSRVGQLLDPPGIAVAPVCDRTSK